MAVDTLEAAVRRGIRDIPDFPKPGIVYKDITPLLRDPDLFRRATEGMAEPYAGEGITHVAAIESRGFILGGPIAQSLGAGLVPIRKAGKLPYDTGFEEYALEYGTDRLEMHTDALGMGDRVLVVDDVLATGGTASAACRLVERLEAQVVACTFLMALSFLPGMEALASRRSSTLVVY